MDGSCLESKDPPSFHLYGEQLSRTSCRRNISKRKKVKSRLQLRVTDLKKRGWGSGERGDGGGGCRGNDPNDDLQSVEF
ncbi:hypothetical protein L1887_28375 [Cichorium endivia]|nr:hypothetical protein L1887_28375 [Cichorium endivia]